MREWVEGTVRRVASLAHQPRVLEVGSGSGLLMWRLAAGSAHYVATDFSAAAVDRLARLLADDVLCDSVTTVCLPAHELSSASLGDALPAGGFDLAVVNSVVQYFPGPRVCRGRGRLSAGDAPAERPDLRR